MAIRWKCTQCDKGVNAPSRMNKMDPRRYCLRCSDGAKRLVERVAPSLERKRGRSLAQRAMKVEKKRVNREALPWHLRDDLITKEYRRIARKIKVSPPAFTISHSKEKVQSSGHCWVGWNDERIHLTIGSGATKARVQMLILHELTHAAMPDAHHDDKFRGRLMEYVYEVFEVDVPSPEGRHIWYLGEAIAKAIQGV